jgi:signal transduction histidine kinase
MGPRKGKVITLESDDAYRHLLENSQDIILIFDRDCRPIYINRVVSSPYLLEPQEAIIGTAFELGLPVEITAFWKDSVRKVLDNQNHFEATFQFSGKDGPLIFEWRFFPQAGKDELVTAILVYGRDITQQYRSEQESQRLIEQVRAGRERLRNLNIQLVNVQEEERRRIANVLADETGQSLSALSIILELISGDLEDATPDVVSRVRDALELVNSTVDKLRVLAQDLRPPTLEVLGLSNTLEGFCREFSRRNKIPVEFTGIPVAELPDSHNIAIYRFLQEALVNVASHVNVNKVWVTLQFDDKSITLIVEDDGDPAEAYQPRTGDTRPRASEVRPTKSRVGLPGMRERFELLGGYVQVLSRAFKGTCLLASLPTKDNFLERRSPDDLNRRR